MNVRSIIVAVFLFSPILSLAQTVSPWFRLTAGISFEQISQKAFTLERVSGAKFSVPLLGNPTGYAVKTNVPNWLSYKFKHTGLVSRMEQDILTTQPNHLVAVSGKLQFFFDRDLLLKNALPFQESTIFHENAFNGHQQLMQDTRTEIEKFGMDEMARMLSQDTSLFSASEIETLISNGQPPAFVLTRGEAVDFANSSLEKQRQIVQGDIHTALLDLHKLLSTKPSDLDTASFAQYYRAKSRLYYFTQLKGVLEKATAPRKSIIFRFRQQLPFDFLPDCAEWLTDAQRLGKLWFYHDMYLTSSPERAALLKQEIKAQSVHEHYAQAEVFGLPYEDLLNDKVLQMQMVMNEEKINQFDQLPVQERMEIALQKMEELTQEMTALRMQSLFPTASFYAEYFRLYTQRGLWQIEYHKAHICTRIFNETKFYR